MAELQVMACELVATVVEPTAPPESHTSVRVTALALVVAARAVVGVLAGSAMSVGCTYQSPQCATWMAHEAALTVAAARASAPAPTFPAVE